MIKVSGIKLILNNMRFFCCQVYIIISVLFVDSILTKRAQGRKRFGMKNFKQRYFCLTNQMFAYSKCKGGIPLCVIPIKEILAVESLQEESFKMKYVSYHVWHLTSKCKEGIPLCVIPIEEILVVVTLQEESFKMKYVSYHVWHLTSKCKEGIPLCVIPVEEILAVETLQEESFKMKYVSYHVWHLTFKCKEGIPCV